GTSPATRPSSSCSGSPSETSRTSGPGNEQRKPVSHATSARPPATSSKAPPPTAGKPHSAPSPSPTPTGSPATSDQPATSFLHRRLDRLPARPATLLSPATRSKTSNPRLSGEHASTARPISFGADPPPRTRGA